MRKKKLMNLLVLTVHVCIHHFALSGELWQVWSTMCCGSEECLQRAWSSGIALIIATAWSRVTTYSKGLLNLFYLNWICCCIKQFCNITNLMKLFFFSYLICRTYFWSTNQEYTSTWFRPLTPRQTVRFGRFWRSSWRRFTGGRSRHLFSTVIYCLTKRSTWRTSRGGWGCDEQNLYIAY